MTATARSRHGEAGHLMAGLMVVLAIMFIFSLVAFQAWEDVLRRDNEAEMIFRGQEIARAIQRYRFDHGGATPPSLDSLMDPGPRGQYYIRRGYDDPLTEEGVWGLLFDGPDGSIVDISDRIDPGRQLGFEENRESSGQQNDPRFLRGGGQRIAGVKSLAGDDPFRVYKGFREYSQWLFTYHDYELNQGGQAQAGGGTRQNPSQPGQRRDQNGGGRLGNDNGGNNRLGGGSR